jgi:hypothetical protein
MEEKGETDNKYNSYILRKLSALDKKKSKEVVVLREVFEF